MPQQPEQPASPRNWTWPPPPSFDIPGVEGGRAWLNAACALALAASALLLLTVVPISAGLFEALGSYAPRPLPPVTARALAWRDAATSAGGLALTALGAGALFGLLNLPAVVRAAERSRRSVRAAVVLAAAAPLGCLSAAALAPFVYLFPFDPRETVLFILLDAAIFLLIAARRRRRRERPRRRKRRLLRLPDAPRK